MRYKGLCLALSIVGMALSLLIIGVKGFNYGVDFKGGSMIEVQSTSGPADIAALREKLGKLGLGAVQIQSFGAPTDVLIRVEQQPGGEAAQQEALKKVTDALAGQYTQRRVEVVGPAVSSELQHDRLHRRRCRPAGDRAPTCGSGSNGSSRSAPSSR